jgi:hypothetical protein
MQLIGGSSLTVKLQEFVFDEMQRLGIKPDDNDDDKQDDEDYEREERMLAIVEEEMSKESSSKKSWQKRGLGYIQEEGEVSVSQDNASSLNSKSGTRSGKFSHRTPRGEGSSYADRSRSSRYHSRADDSSDLSWWSELASLEFDVDSVRSFDIYRYPVRPTYGPGPDLDADDQPGRPSHSVRGT